MARADNATAVSDSHTITLPARRAGAPPTAARGVVAVDRLSRMLRQLMGQIGRAEELADAIAFEIVALKRALEADASGGLTMIAGEALGRARDARRLSMRAEALRNAATGGARKLEIRMRARGEALVRVDEGKWFELPRTVASLLWVLAYGAPRDAGGFSEWQTFDAVVEQLARKTGRKSSRHAVTQIVYRLRGLMARSGANPYLVQVNRQRGLRLLIRK